MKPARPALLGTFAALLLTAAVGTTWFALGSPEAEAASDSLPLPPDIPRLAEGPQYDRCLAMLRTDPEDARAFAETWEASGGGEGARHCAALALLASGEAERGAERLEQLARSSHGSGPARAAVFAQAGQAWMLLGNTGRAYAAATMALTLTPDDLDLLVDRAVALGSMGRYADAMDDLNRAVALDPSRAEPLVFRAAALRHLDRVEEALQDAERALVLAPGNAEALLERGIIRQIKGNTAGAKADWEKVVALAPDSPAADLAQQNLALNEAGPRRR